MTFSDHLTFSSLLLLGSLQSRFPLFDREKFHAWYSFYGNVFLTDQVYITFLLTVWRERARTFFSSLFNWPFYVGRDGLCVVRLTLHLCLLARGSLRVQTERPEARSAVSLLAGSSCFKGLFCLEGNSWTLEQRCPVHTVSTGIIVHTQTYRVNSYL